MKKKIVFLTGTRADYGKIKSLIKSIYNNRKYKIYILVTGMHLSKKYGSTFEEIQKDFPKIKLNKFVNMKEKDSMDLTLSKTINFINKIFFKIKPDLIMLHGDRLETLAAAIVGNFNKFLVAHIEGGEISGAIDESIRHAVSKLSNIHLVSNQSAKKNLIQMGEFKKNIYVMGSPEVDIMISKKLPSLNMVKKRYAIKFKKYSIFCLHSDTNENRKQTDNNINNCILALKKTNHNYVVIYPNNDKNSDVILNKLLKLKKHKNFKIFPSMRFEYFLSLLKNSSYIIGNSSTVVRETPVYGIPSLNLGYRQKNRGISNNIISCKIKQRSIFTMIKKLSTINRRKQMIFGDGNSSKKFVKILDRKYFWETSKIKSFNKLNFNENHPFTRN